MSETLKQSLGPVFRNESSGSPPACIPLNQANYAAARLPIRFSRVTRLLGGKAQHS
jgi:hypothetical protein